MTGKRALVAGVGNLFCTDDGFGTEVARRLGAEALPAGVKVADFGVGALHLAYELMEGCDLLVLVDAAPRGGAPGTLYVIEPDLGPAPGPGDDGDRGGDAGGDGGPGGPGKTVGPAGPAGAGDVLLDAHALTPDGVLALVGGLGPAVGRVRVVGCEPASVEEGIGLTPPVAAAVDEAVRLVRGLVDEVLSR